MVFCSKCGEENRNDSNFCSKCGTGLKNNFGAVQVLEKDYETPKILGWIGLFIFPIIGIIMGIYLITRNSDTKSGKNAMNHGLAILALSFITFLFSILIIGDILFKGL